MQLSGDGSGGVFVVAGQQHRLHAQRCQSVDHPGALAAQRVGQGDVTGVCAIHRQIGDGAALGQIVPGVRRDGHTLSGQQLRIARQHMAALHLGADAPTGDHPEVTGSGQRAAALLAAPHNGFSQRML